MLINDLVELGELIRGRRTEQRLSQTDLAEKVGTTRQWVSRFEKGKNDISAARLLAVLDALELNLDIRPPRPARVASTIDADVPSLIPSATLSAIAGASSVSRNIPESGSLPPVKYPSEGLGTLSSVLVRLAMSVDDPWELERARRRLAEADRRLSQRDADPDDARDRDAGDAQP